MKNQVLITEVSFDEFLEKMEHLFQGKVIAYGESKEPAIKYLSRSQTAKLLCITLPTLHEWTKAGILKRYKISSRVLYKESEVRETLEQMPTFKHKKGV